METEFDESPKAVRCRILRVVGVIVCCIGALAITVAAVVLVFQVVTKKQSHISLQESGEKCQNGAVRDEQTSQCTESDEKCQNGGVWDEQTSQCTESDEKCQNGGVWDEQTSQCTESDEKCQNGGVWDEQTSQCTESGEKCQNGGVWDEQTSQCTECNYKSYGKFCEQYYEDCHDHWNNKIEEQNGEDIKVLIKPQASQEPFMVICRTSYGGQTIVAYRDRDSDDNYNRGWNDYKTGFGDVGNGNFFAGLENIHNLLKGKNGRLKVFYHRVGSKTHYHSNYYNLKIDNELNRYTLHFDYFDGRTVENDGFEFGSARQSIRDAPFCTPDRDCGGCALQSKSGWWFSSSCPRVNLHLPNEADGYMQWPIDGSLTNLQFYKMIFYFDY